MSSQLCHQPPSSALSAAHQAGKQLTLACLLLTVFTATPTLAQSISVEGSTPTLLNGENSCSGTCEITGGFRDDNGSGANLFHTFSTFNIDNGATVTFTDPGVTNIFSSVNSNTLTPSNIDGILRVDGLANLYLLNASGIVFGENATLDIPGSFLSSTADTILFSSGEKFGTAHSSVSPLLTIGIPTGLQFGNTPQPIEINGSGSNNLAYQGDATISRTNPTTGLISNEGQSLAFLGGNLNLTGGNIAAESGRVELGSVGKNSRVNFTSTPTKWDFDYSAVSIFQDITLSERASIDVSGDNAGFIQLQGRNMSLRNGSAILAKVLTDGGGQINLNASNNLILEGVNISADNPMPTSVLIEIAPGTTGDGSSRLSVKASNIDITEGAQVGLGMGGSGTAGNVTVTANTIQTEGASNVGPSSFYSAVLPIFSPPYADGQGGNLTINTDKLSVLNGSQISTSTFGIGDAGNLTVNAKDIRVSGVLPTGSSSIRSASEFPGQPFTPLPSTGSGNAGNLTINTERLTVSDIGQIVVATVSDNTAGNLIVNASEYIKLSGEDKSGRSGLLANSILSNGEGGNIQVNTDRLSVLEGATVNVSVFSSNAGTPPGSGPAGNINIVANTVEVKDSGLITADTTSGDRANINIQSDSLVLRQGGLISTNAVGTATGGNISINTDALIAFENSDITANATDNVGGRIIVNAHTILGTSYRNELTEESDITATSSLGPAFSGTVEINTPDIDPSEGITTLPEGLNTEAQVAAACEKIDSNNFIATGRGGLPTDASRIINEQSVWNDFRLSQETESIAATEESPINTHSLMAGREEEAIQPDVVEAQGWSFNRSGEVVFTDNNASPHEVGQAANCLAS